MPTHPVRRKASGLARARSRASATGVSKGLATAKRATSKYRKTRRR